MIKVAYRIKSDWHILCFLLVIQNIDMFTVYLIAVFWHISAKNG
jgi:hypothetical protein